MLRKWMVPVAAFGVLAIVPAQANAQDNEQLVEFVVQAISEISVAGSPSLTISLATAGSQPDVDTDGATYSITTNESSRNIMASLDADMPSGVTLSLTMTAPASGTSAGKVALSSTAAALVNGVSEVAESGIAMEYELDANVSAGPVSGSRTVTFTIAAGA